MENYQRTTRKQKQHENINILTSCADPLSPLAVTTLALLSCLCVKNHLWTLETIGKCIVVECNKMIIFFIQTSGFFFFPFPFVCENKVEMEALNRLMFSEPTGCLSSELQGTAVGGGWVRSLGLNASFPSLSFYYCLLGIYPICAAEPTFMIGVGFCKSC